MSDSAQITGQPAATAGAAAAEPVGPAPGSSGAGNDYAPRIPAAVRRAARRAEELQAEMAANLSAEQQLDDAVGNNTAPIQPNEPQPQPQPHQPHQPQQPQQPQDESWQHRYRTLQGKYDAEVPQLRAQIQGLEHLIATMQQAPAAQPQPQQPQPQLELQLNEAIPEEDYNTYGPDFVDSTRRWARAELAPVVNTLAQQVAELRANQQQTSGDRVKDRVRTELDRDPQLAGRWMALDTDPGFNAWLQEFDPFSGARRLDLLRHAYASGDGARTGMFFKAYLHEHTDILREPQPHQPQTPLPNGNGAAPMDLAAFAAPGRASNATPGPGAPEQRIWTNRDIQAFYDGRMRGRYRGREAEADRLERDILAAAAEGRIRNA